MVTEVPLEESSMNDRIAIDYCLIDDPTMVFDRSYLSRYGDPFRRRKKLNVFYENWLELVVFCIWSRHLMNWTQIFLQLANKIFYYYFLLFYFFNFFLLVGQLFLKSEAQ